MFGVGWEKLGAGIYKGDPADSATWAVGALYFPFSQRRKLPKLTDIIT